MAPGNLSARGTNQQQQALFFEKREDAVKRTTKRKFEEEEGLQVPKRHSPEPTSVVFDKEGLLEEVNNMKDGEKVFNFHNKNMSIKLMV